MLPISSGLGDTYSYVCSASSQYRATSSFSRPRPAFGKRVLVLFEDEKYYPGTIKTHGNSVKDVSHSEGRWGVLFDDCTEGRFEDGANDGELPYFQQPRVKKYSTTQEANGRGDSSRTFCFLVRGTRVLFLAKPKIVSNGLPLLQIGSSRDCGGTLFSPLEHSNASRHGFLRDMAQRAGLCF